MNTFKSLTADAVLQPLTVHELIAEKIQAELTELQSQNAPTAKEPSAVAFYKYSQVQLVTSTFFLMYGMLEDALYLECDGYNIKKNASILRFETALKDQGYDVTNQWWNTLLDLAKIRNCLLHGNGRLDTDRYGIETKNVINALNCHSSALLIEVIDVQGTTRIKLNNALLRYFYNAVVQFINVQNI